MTSGSRCRIEIEYEETTRVYTGILREATVNTDYADVRTWDAPTSTPIPTENSVILQLVNMREEYEFDSD